ncbi:MAG TPA: GGDEF domain-containing protein [Longimicrobiales bacterium]|nr:GGDEF domain-containing protein [Longimicrobiales bacterium]
MLLNDQFQPFVSIIGVLLQLVGSTLLAALFLLLRPHSRRRRYFRTWSLAWLALALAVGAIAARYLLIAGPPLDAVEVRTPGAVGLDIFHQLARLTFVALLVVGTRQFTHGTEPGRVLRLLAPALLGYTALSLWQSTTLREVLLWQTPVAIVGFGWCAVQIGALAPSRQRIGTLLSSGAFAIMALVAVVYVFAFGYSPAGAAAAPLELVARLHPYVEIVLHVVLGYGMVVLMMEDAKREVDAANAELAVAHSVMRRAALYDSLTGCLNRRAFAEGVGLATARAGFGSVISFDLDDLKAINDAYGHSAGDALLRHLTDALRAELRPSDKLYRWGGDEFLMLLPGADAIRARARLEDVVSQAAVLRLGPHGEEVRLKVSIGCAAYGGAEQIEEAIDVADAMMYHEKARRKAVRV